MPTIIFVGVLVVAAVAAVRGDHSPVPSPTASSPAHVLPDAHISPPVQSAGYRPGAPDEHDGAVPDGTSVFDDDVPGVAKLDRALLKALRRAATTAADDGVTFVVDSGWRSRNYQEQLLNEAVGKYGSEAEAARWVATPDTSAHVSGDAVDLGPTEATAWLSRHGAAYGLCQIYRNEPWHFELRPDAVTHGCQRMYADPTHDPRMQP